MRRHRPIRGGTRPYNNKNNNSNDCRIRNCNNTGGEFPENRRIAEQHAWMWSLFQVRPATTTTTSRKRQQSTPIASSTLLPPPKNTMKKEIGETPPRQVQPDHPKSNFSESSLSALLLADPMTPSPPMHRQTSFILDRDKSKDHHLHHHHHHHSYENSPPIPLEISFPIHHATSNDNDVDSETSFDTIITKMQHSLGNSSLAGTCEQMLGTLALGDSSSLVHQTSEDTKKEYSPDYCICTYHDENEENDDDDESSSCWHHHHHHQYSTIVPNSFHNSTTTHDSTWGMTTTTLEDEEVMNGMEKHRAATWSGGASSLPERPKRVHFSS